MAELSRTAREHRRLGSRPHGAPFTTVPGPHPATNSNSTHFASQGPLLCRDLVAGGIPVIPSLSGPHALQGPPTSLTALSLPSFPAL